MRALIYSILESFAKAITASANPVVDFFTILSGISTLVIALMVYAQNRRFNEENKKLQISIHNREIIVARDDKIISIFTKITEVFSYLAVQDAFFHLQVGSVVDIEKHISKFDQFNEELYNIQDISRLLFGEVDKNAIAEIDAICVQYRKMFSDYNKYYLEKMSANNQEAYRKLQTVYSDIYASGTPDLKILCQHKEAFHTYLQLCSSQEIIDLKKAFEEVRSSLIGLKPDSHFADIFAKYLRLPLLTDFDTNHSIGDK